MKKIILFVALAATSFTLFAQPKQGAARPSFAGFFGPRQETVQVWPDGAPNAFEITAEERERVKNNGSDYTVATLDIYPARNPNGLCVIACPGGGYAMLSNTHEAKDFKDWYNARGITLAVLQYRLPREHHDVPLSDVKEAIRIMKGREDLGVKHVGVMGCSAGGHLASTAATHITGDLRPEFQILFYPVITMDLSFTHRDSHDRLIGKDASQELVDLYSNDKQVTPETCPAFIVAASDDFLVPVKNSLVYYQALVDNHVSATMHLYPTGGHGFGVGDNYIYKADWSQELNDWLNVVIKK
ncbi:MAG: alpha/beta hydrolase [Bacteroidia bacterium]|nr:alpha/beta hydrolase [Bacteroidia bacterium]